MKYYLTITAKRKDAKRHIVKNGFNRTFETIEAAEKTAANLNRNYIIEIYNGNWDLVKVVNG